MSLVDRVEQQKKSRPVYIYKLPEEVANGITSIGIMELSAAEELMATRRAGNDVMRLAYELAKQSVAEINGQPVTIADGSADKAFDEMSPKVRNLIMQVYGKLHSPSEEVVEDFLASQTIKVA